MTPAEELLDKQREIRRTRQKLVEQYTAELGCPVYWDDGILVTGKGKPVPGAPVMNKVKGVKRKAVLEVVRPVTFRRGRR